MYLVKRLNEFFTKNSFHDAHIYSIKINNLYNPDVGYEEKDPTTVESHLMHSNGDEYLVSWNGVIKFLMDYDISRHTYHNSNEIVGEGMSGLDDWICDEITSHNEEYLSHEILLASDTKIMIHCREIDIKKK